MNASSHRSRDKVCIVHLVRRCNGIDVFKNFVSAYKKHNAGVSHVLLLVFKGFDENEGVSEYRDCLVDMDYRELFVIDKGFDIGSYMKAFQAYREKFEYFCFLNSYSEPLREGWLELLFRHISLPGVGIVGTTGSWQSFTSACDFRAFTYARSFKSFLKPILRVILPIYSLRFLLFFPLFPNAHIRTNGFLIPTQILDHVVVHPVNNKIAAYRFENGRDSLTRQIQSMGLRPVLAGADGKAYEIADWPLSNTFRRAEQDNLLIADNQTEAYSEGDQNLKARYSYYAWGEDAYPDESML